MGKIIAALKNKLTGAYVAGILRLMSVCFRLSPKFRRNILDEREGRQGYTFNARVQFRTVDDTV